MLEGDFLLRGRGVNADGTGAVDLADNAFSRLSVAVQLRNPELFGGGVALNGAELEATLDGPFRDLSIPHTLSVREIDAGIMVQRFVQQGTARYDGSRLIVPLNATLARIVSGNDLFDPRLVNGSLGGTLVYAGRAITSDDLDLRFAGLRGQLGLNANLANGKTQVTGPVTIDDLVFNNIGLIDARAQVRFTIGGGAPWRVAAQLDGKVDRVTNSTLAALAGEDIAFAGGLTLASRQPVLFDEMRVRATKVTALLDGRVDGAGTTLLGTGEHVDYGPFTVEAQFAADGPRAQLVFADPLPAAGLADVRVDIAPSADGFLIETSGGSLLGAFDGTIDLTVDESGQTTFGITRLDVANSRVRGDLALVDGGFSGALKVERGGIAGTIGLAMRDGEQGYALDLAANNAAFAGPTPISIARGTIDARGVLAPGNTTLQGRANLQGLTYGNFFLGRLAARAQIRNGAGEFDAALAGQRGSRFNLAVDGQLAPGRIAVAVDGSYAGRAIAMPRRAVFTQQGDGAWELARTRLSYGAGSVIASGAFGGPDGISGRVALADMPLQLADAVADNLGLGGTISGVVTAAAGPDGLPVGEARLVVEGLTRSSRLLSSQPLDMSLVAELSGSLLQARAVMSDPSGASGRVQARISDLPRGGGLGARLYAGNLRAQMRFNGSAAALWRLAALDLIDITGDVAVAANARGTLADPLVRGAIRGDDLRLRSALTGTDITQASVRGRFDGSRLNLTRFAGNADNGGRVSGSGFIDLAGMTATRGPRIDLKIAAREAQILDLKNMRATVTGPIRIVSNGVGGTVAGRLEVQRAFWQLGGAEAVRALPDIATTEINLPADTAPVRAPSAPWRYLIDARSRGGLDVDGMGLDSEWRGDLRLRGTTADPRIGGQVEIVPRQGFYSFAGVRFEITRGQIDFDENQPIDPQIDLVAETQVDALSVAVNVAGRASQPDITFSSTPALPEEELLARLLFGGSITNLSATDALQLGAAVASLRGGSGTGPINRLRNAIGIDRLRIVPADAALDRGTAVALGKNFGRRIYVEVITDGAGYNATDLEFRVTGWLNLLASVSTIGRQSAAAEYRRDY